MKSIAQWRPNLVVSALLPTQSEQAPQLRELMAVFLPASGFLGLDEFCQAKHENFVSIKGQRNTMWTKLLIGTQPRDFSQQVEIAEAGL